MNFDRIDHVFDDTFSSSKIHIRVQQMGKKWITTIDGLDEDLDLKRISRAMKKSLHCSVSVSKTRDDVEIIQLQGDQREFLREWLVVNEVLSDKEADVRLLIHGA
jgi:translation initiation factor 1